MILSSKKRQKLTASGSGIAALMMGGLLFQASSGQAQPPAFDPAKVKQGLAIAPVPLNMQGKDPNLVGYGSYLVNASGDCNGCHSAGPQTAWAPGGNPYFGQRAVVNPATYLGGGNDFGAFPDPAGPFPHIITRNLTPDNSGLPIGGDTLDEFIQVMRTGVDPDKVHPTCAGPPNGKCIPPPFNGDLLQIMPWPIFATCPMTICGPSIPISARYRAWKGDPASLPIAAWFRLRQPRLPVRRVSP